MKIAPRLIKQTEIEVKVSWDKEIALEAQRELRALLAVAKWAKIRHHDLSVGDDSCELCRALARLDKVSKKGTP